MRERRDPFTVGDVRVGLVREQEANNFGMRRTAVAVIGLHTVFEHHAAMTPVSLKAFLHEYRITFPVGVDMPAPQSPVPQTMQAYGLRGTPSLILIDREGRLRRHGFGPEDDLAVGAAIATLVAETSQP